MKQSHSNSRIKIRAKNIDTSIQSSHKYSFSEINSPNEFQTLSKSSSVKDPFLNMRQAGLGVPTLRPSCPPKKSASRNSICNLPAPKMSLPSKLKLNIQSPCLSSRTPNKPKIALSRNNSAYDLLAPIIETSSRKSLIPFSPKTKIRIPNMEKDLLLKSQRNCEGMTRRDLKTPNFNTNAYQKHCNTSESESYGSESTVLPQSGEISIYEGGVERSESNADAYERIKKLMTENEKGEEESPYDVSFGMFENSSSRKRRLWRQSSMASSRK
ncbi:unnamed protein product [Blepharisma stoltei]|uniref:Uncharacterized protein n=1 Tax=Blepharisma stoltei TaxID=1481888 RepID=A0AAU9JQ04_9CILI|nr:unnamed protein product [Blepharisma stoltei]